MRLFFTILLSLFLVTNLHSQDYTPDVNVPDEDALIEVEAVPVEEILSKDIDELLAPPPKKKPWYSGWSGGVGLKEGNVESVIIKKRISLPLQSTPRRRRVRRRAQQPRRRYICPLFGF